MKKIALITTLAVLALGSFSVANASSTFYGMSGLIETPDDSQLPVAGISLTENYSPDFNNTNYTGVTTGAAFGLLPKLEVSGAVVDSDAAGVKAKGIINAKYSVFKETAVTPSLSIGVVDAGKNANNFTGGKISDPSMFVVFGKNLTNLAEGISGNTSKPLKGTLGFGSGLYKGAFAGLQWYMSPKTDVMFEYLSNGARQKTTFNAALKYHVYSGLSINAGTIGFDSVYMGASYTLTGF